MAVFFSYRRTRIDDKMTRYELVENPYSGSRRVKKSWVVETLGADAHELTVKLDKWTYLENTRSERTARENYGVAVMYQERGGGELYRQWKFVQDNRPN